MKCFLLLTLLILTACEYSEDQLADGSGLYVCSSNAGRPDLVLHSETLHISRRMDGNHELTFIEFNTGVKYRLYAIQDSDYSCEKKA